MTVWEQERVVRGNRVGRRDTVEIAADCPYCGLRVLLHPMEASPDWVSRDGPRAETVFGIRRCPNPDCMTLVFVEGGRNGEWATVPRARLQFETSGVPSGIVKHMREALECHANGCFIACAIMVRRVLEEICADQGAVDRRLPDRLKSLSKAVFVPPALLEGVDLLRQLGNDAAHVELKYFDKVGVEEAEAAIEIAIGFLKAVYQSDQATAKLAALKRKASEGTAPH